MATMPQRTPPAPNRRLACGWLAGAVGWPARASPAPTLRVGPGEALRSLAEAARRATDGQVIELAPGEYRGETAVLQGRSITLRGLGAGAVLHADGRHAEGKALLVVRGEVRLENLTLRGCRVPDGNGAGVRFERGHLQVHRCRFLDNEMGLLTGNDPDSSLALSDCHFGAAPRHPGPLHHLLYAGAIGRLDVRGCRFEGGWRGHLLKSRAWRNHVLGNWLVDGAEGAASYEIDFPDGGDNLVAGNVIAQGPATQNPALLSMGAEGRRARPGRLRLVNNTLLSAAVPGASFLAWWDERMAPGAQLWALNNVLAGPAQLALPAAADGGGNARVPAEVLDAQLRLLPRAALSALPLAEDLPELHDFSAPLGSRVLSRRPSQPGAQQPAG